MNNPPLPLPRLFPPVKVSLPRSLLGDGRACPDPPTVSVVLSGADTMPPAAPAAGVKTGLVRRGAWVEPEAGPPSCTSDSSSALWLGLGDGSPGGLQRLGERSALDSKVLGRLRALSFCSCPSAALKCSLLRLLRPALACAVFLRSHLGLVQLRCLKGLPAAAACLSRFWLDLIIHSGLALPSAK